MKRIVRILLEGTPGVRRLAEVFDRWRGAPTVEKHDLHCWADLDRQVLEYAREAPPMWVVLGGAPGLEPPPAALHLHGRALLIGPRTWWWAERQPLQEALAFQDLYLPPDESALTVVCEALVAPAWEFLRGRGDMEQLQGALLDHARLRQPELQGSRYEDVLDFNAGLARTVLHTPADLWRLSVGPRFVTPARPDERAGA